MVNLENFGIYVDDISRVDDSSEVLTSSRRVDLHGYGSREGVGGERQSLNSLTS